MMIWHNSRRKISLEFDTEHVAVNHRSARNVEPEGLKISKCVCDQNLDKIEELLFLLDKLKCSQSVAGSQGSSKGGYPGNPPSQYQNSYQPPGETPYYPKPQYPSPSGQGQAPGPYYPSPQSTSQQGIYNPGPTPGQTQPSYPVTSYTGNYSSNPSNPTQSNGIPSNSGSTLPTSDITQDGNQPDKSSTTDSTSNQVINGSNNVQISNVNQETTILAPGQSIDDYNSNSQQPTTPGTGGAPSDYTPHLLTQTSPQQPGTGYPGAPVSIPHANSQEDSVTANTPLGTTSTIEEDAGDANPDTSYSQVAPPDSIQADNSNQQDSINSDTINSQKANGENSIQNVDSETVNTITENKNIEVFDLDGFEDDSIAGNSSPQSVTPTQINAASQTGPTTIYDTTTVTNNQEVAIGENIAQSQDVNQNPTNDQSYNTNVSSYPINNSAQPQGYPNPQSGYSAPGYQQPQTSTYQPHDDSTQETDNVVSQATKIEFSPIIINEQDTTSQQDPIQTIREQGDIYSTTTYPPNLVGHDVLYNNPSSVPTIDNNPQVIPIYDTPQYNTPSITPIPYNPHPDGHNTEIIIEGIKKQPYPYIDEIVFTSNGDIMNYFDMKQISGTPTSHGGFNSYQSFSKNVSDKDVQTLKNVSHKDVQTLQNVSDKDVQTLKNELNAQHITLDKIVASLKKCNCYCQL